jgi:uridine kinase
VKTIFVGISGGSGAGKSSLTAQLMASEPDTYGFIELDDYMKKSEDVPKLRDRDNWDHPEAVDFDALVQDLTELKAGHPIKRLTKNRSYNPGFGETRTKIPIEVRPHPIMLVEGFLVLYDRRVRDLLDKTIWLEAGHERRWERRAHFKDTEYESEIHKPMHEQFVQPTRQYADITIDAEGKSKEEVLAEVKRVMRPYFTSELRKFL